MDRRTEPRQVEGLAGASGGWSLGRFALFLAVAIAIMFPGPLFGTRTFVYRDFGLFGYPLAWYWKQCFWEGQLPLWNPYNDCGLPFLAQWNTMVLYPLDLIYLLLPLPWSLNLFCLFHLFLAGLGMYWLARHWTGHELAAAVAGTAYAFNGLTLHCLMWPNNIAALAWLPCVLWLAERARVDGGRWVIAAGIAGTVQALAGAPEIILFTWVFVATLGFVQTLSSRQPLRQWLVRLTGMGLCVAGLGAVQWLPFLELLLHSHRHMHYGQSFWPMPIWGWANLLVPAFHMKQSVSGVLYQGSQAWTSSYYAGIGVLALTVWLWTQRAREPKVLALSGLAIAGLVLALGDAAGVYKWLRTALPVLNFMRYPVKYVVWPIFALPLLAAFAIKAWDCLPRDSVRNRGRRGFLLLALVFIAACLALGWWGWLHPIPKEDGWLSLESGLTRAVFVGLVLGSAYAWRLADLGVKRTLLGYGLVLLVWLDAVTHAPPQNPTVHPSVYREDFRQMCPLEPMPRLGDGRAMLGRFARHELYSHAITNQAQCYLLLRLWAYGNANLLDRLPKVGGFYSLYPRWFQEVYDLAFGDDGQPRPALADFLGVIQVTSTNKAFEWVQRRSAMRWVSAGQKPEFVEADDLPERLAAPGFDPRRMVLLPAEAREHIQAREGTDVQVISSHFEPEQVNVVVEAAAPAWVVIAQTDYPCWKATVDGNPARIWRANGAFQAVEVPAGRHHIELRYVDRQFRSGMLISLFALLACMAGWWCGRVPVSTGALGVSPRQLFP